ncbi:MAG: hypothetical protein WCJ61_02075 [Paludibacter sp.]
MDEKLNIDDIIYELSNNDPENIKLNSLDLNNIPTEIVFTLLFGENSQFFFESELAYNKLKDQFEDCIIKTSELLDKKKLMSFHDQLVQLQIYLMKNGLVVIDYHEEFLIKQKSQLEIVEALYRIMQYKLSNKLNIELIIKGTYTNKVNLNDEKIINEFQKFLVTEFENQNLNEANLTFDEAKQEIDEYEDGDFIQEYLDNSYHHPFKGIIYDIENVPDDFINIYADVHYKKVETTIELVKTTLDDLKFSINNSKVKKGAKSKNKKLGNLALQLSYLYNFNEFINQNEIDSIYDFKISNDCFRFIYEYFEIWGVLKNKTSIDDDEHRANIIKSIISQIKKKNFHSLFKNLELVNKIRRVKFGNGYFNDKEIIHIPNMNANLEFTDHLNKKYLGH